MKLFAIYWNKCKIKPKQEFNVRGILNYGKEEKSFLGNSHTINYF